MHEPGDNWVKTWAHFGIDGRKSGAAQGLLPEDEIGANYCYGWYMYLQWGDTVARMNLYKEMGWQDAKDYYESD